MKVKASGTVLGKCFAVRWDMREGERGFVDIYPSDILIDSPEDGSPEERLKHTANSALARWKKLDAEVRAELLRLLHSGEA